MTKYEIIRLLAETGHSKVYLVRHKTLGLTRVAKLMEKCGTDCDRILREADFIKNLKHEGIPIIYDIDCDDFSICIIEEYISGKSLTEFIEQYRDVPEFSKKLPLELIVNISLQICEVVEYLHNCAGIIHMDLKPDNIIIKEDFFGNISKCSSTLAYNPDYSSVKVGIIDFDSSLYMNSKESFSGYGTPGFAAPEQYDSKAAVQSDIYSIGMIILYMVSDNNIQSFAKDKQLLQSTSIGAVIEKCIRHNSSQRFQSISEIKKELKSISEGLSGFSKARTDNGSENMDIYVAGTRSGVGVTHFCLCLSSFLAGYSSNKCDVVCIRHNDRWDYKNTLLCDRLCEDGTYKPFTGRACYDKNSNAAKCVHILPDYCGGILCDISEYGIRIHDLGPFSGIDEEIKKKFEEKPEDNTYYVLVGDYGYRSFDSSLMDMVSKETILFFNHIGGTQLYIFIRENKPIQRCFRIPCIYDWTETNTLFGEAVTDAFHLDRKKTPGFMQNIRKKFVEKIYEKAYEVFGKLRELLCKGVGRK